MSWIQVPEGPHGLNGDILAQQLEQRVQVHIAAGTYKRGDVEYVRDVSFMPVKGELSLSTQRLERLRRLCQLWEVDLTQPREITSHRKLLGPVIVAVKKVFFPILKVFFKDTLRRQRDFNAAVIALVADLANESEPGSTYALKAREHPKTDGAGDTK